MTEWKLQILIVLLSGGVSVLWIIKKILEEIRDDLRKGLRKQIREARDQDRQAENEEKAFLVNIENDAETNS
jgi:hypothetical protein